MNPKVLSFVEKLESFKTEIKALHWDSDNLSQHKLCDDIASLIADFQDQVSEVEQSISGKLPKNEFKPKGGSRKVGSLKSFVEGVLSATNAFYKELGKMGDDYIGMRSDCESFLSNMQRELYLVNFTLKEDLKRRLRGRLNESMPKNPMNVDDDGFDKFIGRRPKTVKGRINQIYKIVKRYGIDSRIYGDDHWQAIDDYYRAITSLGCEVELKPCGHMSNADSMMSDGGYCDYDPTDNMPRSKQYAIKITFDDGMKIDGYIKCMACGSMEDPFSKYDTCMVLWPKTRGMLKSEGRDVRLSEGELMEVLKRATVMALNETRLDYDIDNFSGRWNKVGNGYDLTSGDEYIDDEGYLDDPYKHDEIEDALADDEWEWGDDMDLKGAENWYSWDRFDNKPIAPGLDDYYKVGRRAVPREVDGAIQMRNRNNDWTDKELRHGNRMMGKWIDGKRSPEEVGDAWEDLHYEGKAPVRVTESELRQVVAHAAMKLINESGIEIKPSKEGTFTAAAKKHGKSVQGFASQVLGNKDDYSPSMVKKANFARNAKKWKH